MHPCLAYYEALAGVRGVVFDCDGVLVDSREANAAYYGAFRKHFGLPPLSEAEKDYVHMHTVRESLAFALPGITWEETAEFRSRMDYRDILSHLRLEEGLLSLISAMRGLGYRLAVNTNRMDTMDLLLDHFGLTGFFAPVVTANTVANAKPHQESMRRILGMWRMRPGEVVYVGDSSVDERTASASGVRFWAYKNRDLRADLHLDGFTGLAGCLCNALTARMVRKA